MHIVPGSEDDVPGQITINPRGDEARERAKHEQFDTEVTRRSGVTAHFKPGNPWAHREYPKMLYKALENQRWQGKLMCMEPEPAAYNFNNEDLYQRAKDGAAAFTAACQRIVGSEAEELAAKAEGWRNSAKEAMAGGKDRQFEEFVQAGHRAHDDRNMSDLAKAEAKAAEDAEPGVHVLEVKAQPRRKPGPKPKAKEAPESIPA